MITVSKSNLILYKYSSDKIGDETLVLKISKQVPNNVKKKKKKSLLRPVPDLLKNRHYRYFATLARI